jgi:hypothetical protein
VVGTGVKRKLILRDAQHEYTFTESDADHLTAVAAWIDPRARGSAVLARSYALLG